MRVRPRSGAALETLRPHMSEDEQRCYQEHLGRSETVVEFGLGGSTLLALRLPNITKFVGVDSDLEWIRKLNDTPEAAAGGRSAKFLHADIGEVGAWGRPSNNEKIDSWPQYSLAPWGLIGRPDLVFVDGRFRVSCIMESVLRGRSDTLTIVHDYWDRSEYHCTLPFLEWQESCGTLGVFTAKQGLNREAAAALLEEYRFVPD